MRVTSHMTRSRIRSAALRLPGEPAHLHRDYARYYGVSGILCDTLYRRSDRDAIRRSPTDDENTGLSGKIRSDAMRYQHFATFDDLRTILRVFAAPPNGARGWCTRSKASVFASLLRTGHIGMSRSHSPGSPAAYAACRAADRATFLVVAPW